MVYTVLHLQSFRGNYYRHLYLHNKKGINNNISFARGGHSYMYLITHLRRKGIYHGAIYLRNWNSLHPISTNKSKFCHFR